MLSECATHRVVSTFPVLGLTSCRHLAELTRLCSPEMTHSASRGTRFSLAKSVFGARQTPVAGPGVFPVRPLHRPPPFTPPAWLLLTAQIRVLRDCAWRATNTVPIRSP